MRTAPLWLVPRRLLVSVAALLVVVSAAPRFAGASGSEPAPMPPSNPLPQTPPEVPMSPEEKAAVDRKQAQELYADAYKECDKAKAELEEAGALAKGGDAKAAEKAKKKTESAQKRLAKQVDKFQRATTLDPKYHEAWNMLGFCLRKTGETQKALQAYWECLRLAPDYAPAHEYLGEAYLEQGNLEKAQAELTWLKEKDATLAAQLEKKITAYSATKTQPAATGSN